MSSPQNIKSSDGALYQLTFIGDNDSVAFSPLSQKLIYSKKISKDAGTTQIYELDLVSNKEKRITFNLGDNAHPSFHPHKNWIVYSSSKDESIEKLPVQNLMKEYGLDTSPLMENEIGHEVYVSTLDGSDIQRLTKNKGFDGHPVFSANGDKIYFLRHDVSFYELISHDLASHREVTLVSQKNPIVDFHANGSYLAVITLMDTGLSELKILNLKKPSDVVFQLVTESEIKNVFLHKSEPMALVSADFNADSNLDIYQIQWTKNCAARLTSESYHDVSPVYGNESKSFIFSSDRTQSYQIYTMTLNPNTTCSPLKNLSK